MKTSIYVFSGTGTSLAIAQKIGNELGGDVEILSIPNQLKKAQGNEIRVEASKVGIIFPCYFGEIPALVLEFVRKLNIDNANYIFSVVTAGGNIGYSLKFLAKELNKKGKKLDYGKSIVVSSNYIVAWYYSAILKNGDKRKKALQLLDEKSIQMAQDITNEKKELEGSQYLFYKIPHIISPKEVVQDTRSWDKEFSADEKCNGCSMCCKVCPVQNIKIINSKPEFQHNCQRCMACLQYCPNNAIRLNGKPINKPKYFHPEVPAKEMMKFIHKGF